MAADVETVLTIVAMGFAITMFIISYRAFNSAIVGASKESAFYSFVQFTETISSSFKSEDYASITNINFYPNYVIFVTSFETINDLNYYLVDGMKYSYKAVTLDSVTLIEQILNSVSESTNSIEFYASYEELKKCVGTDCICFAETEDLLFSQEYLEPNVCIEVCWGEYPEIYSSCLEQGKDSATSSRQLYLDCNEEVAISASLGDCQKCVEYMSDYSNNFEVVQKDGFELLLFDSEEDIKKFSHATKYSFLPNVISCKTINEIKDLANKEGLCSGIDIHIKYDEDDVSGFFGMITTSRLVDEELVNEQAFIELLEMNFNKNYGTGENSNELLSCDSTITYLRTEAVENE